MSARKENSLFKAFFAAAFDVAYVNGLQKTGMGMEAIPDSEFKRLTDREFDARQALRVHFKRAGWKDAHDEFCDYGSACKVHEPNYVTDAEFKKGK